MIEFLSRLFNPYVEVKRYSANGLSPLYFFFDRRSPAIVEKYVSNFFWSRGFFH